LTAAVLYDEWDNVQIPNIAKVVFYAEAKLEVRYRPLQLEIFMKLIIMSQGELVPLVLHPVLWKYFLKVDINNQSVDHDYDLPKEELNSPAVDPPMLSLMLENHQGYPQVVTVQATSDSQSVGVTVQDVLRATHEDVGTLIRRREWTRLNAEGRAAVEIAFRERCRTDEELGQGPCRVDFLCGRDSLQILPKLSPDGPVLPAAAMPVNFS